MRKNPSSTQSDASRANGSLSNGPVTADGKARSAANSRTLGLCATQVVLPGESQEEFQAHFNSLIDEHKPKTPTEEILVEDMAVASWRARRARAAFTKAIGNLDLSDSLDDEKLARKLTTIQRYETQYTRQFSRARRLLIESRAAVDREQKREAECAEENKREVIVRWVDKNAPLNDYENEFRNEPDEWFDFLVPDLHAQPNPSEI